MISYPQCIKVWSNKINTNFAIPGDIWKHTVKLVYDMAQESRIKIHKYE